MGSILYQLRQDLSLSAMVAGLLAVTISYAGPLVIFFQAAQSANIDNAMMISWIWAVSIGSAVGSIVLSLWYKVPVLLAWSIPGTALLVSLFPNISLNEAVGAYLVAGVISLIIGLSGYFDKILNYIPQGIAGGMMAGILFGFGVEAFVVFGREPILACTMLGVYLFAKRFSPRYAIIWVLLTGLVVAYVIGLITPIQTFNLNVAKPIWISPEFSWQAVINLALPLVILNLTGQFLPGMSLIKLNDYQLSSKPVINTASILSIIVALFGGISIVLAAVTSALCMGGDCHEDPKKRYVGGVFNGIFYLVGAMFAGSIVALFAILPKSLIALLAGLALLGGLLANINIAMQDGTQRESALITFLVTASGMTLFGLSSVFWGIVLGMTSYFILQMKLKHSSLT